MSKLPIGDKTLSAKEIIANESQERMGLLIKEEAIEHVRKIAERERAPMYVVGETTGDHRFSFQQADGVRPFDLAVEQMFGSSPKTYMIDKTVERHYEMPEYELPKLHEYLTNVLQLEAVAFCNFQRPFARFLSGSMSTRYSFRTVAKESTLLVYSWHSRLRAGVIAMYTP